ncbi:unnamed protein product [Rotaria sordida]|uniref:MIF4G domain-containing protein n=1 Tax=Rotaria sordida TaxID=392033 RepID=A0A815DY85_9BILA|nr:unnamed protein product [Rotaria sordida]CAF1576328.1 unnamed protein product [Rotaria sordida]
MNNTDQPLYYPNPVASHSQTSGFYMPNDGMKQPYPISTNYQTRPVPSTMSNQPKTLHQPPDTLSDLQEQIQIHPTQSTQDTKIDEPTVPISQSTIAQNIQQSNSCASTVSSRAKRKRKKNHCLVDSVLHKPVEVSTQLITSTTTTSSVSSTIITNENHSIESTTTKSIKPNAKSTNDTNKTQKQARFSQESADIFTDSFNIQPDKSDNRISTMNEEISTNSLKSQSTPSKTTISHDEKSLAPSKKRFHYDRQELLRIRDSLAPFPIPERLRNLDIVINRCDNNNNNSNRSLTSNSNRKTEVHLSTKPDFSNHVANSYEPVDQNKIDANNRFLCNVRSILNKLTPQTYDELQKQLVALDFDCCEKLEGMIMILHSKAVDEPHYSFLYAKLCKQLRKKHVNVLDKDGKPKKCTLRPLLMICCKKEFNNDNIQEIEYEKRKLELETITDEKKYQEEAEILEDLIKARRRKLGNIVFIGELFQVQIFPHTIIYDCIEYLLRDKTDEASLECLCNLLRTIGDKLDNKVKKKSTNKSKLEKYYCHLNTIVKEQKASARIRFMIQNLLELRQTAWGTCRPKTKPTTIDEIHDQEHLNRERQQHHDQNHETIISSAYSGSSQQPNNNKNDNYDSEIKQQSKLNNKQNDLFFLWAINLTSSCIRTKELDIEKKLGEDRSLTEQKEN